MQFGFIPEKRTIDPVFFFTRLQEEYCAERMILYMCFVDLEKVFDRVPKKVLEWVMGEKGISEIFAKSVMSLHAKTKVRVDAEL